MAGGKQQTEKLSDRIYRIDRMVSGAPDERRKSLSRCAAGKDLSSRRRRWIVQLTHPGEAEKQILQIL